MQGTRALKVLATVVSLLVVAAIANITHGASLNRLISDSVRSSGVELNSDERQLLRRALAVVEERYLNEIDTSAMLTAVFKALREDHNKQEEGVGTGGEATADDEKFDRVESALNIALRELDAHTAYLTPNAYSELTVRIRGEFGGLGLEVTMEDDAVKVVAPIDDTPAQRAGMQPGDLITHVDGQALTGMSLREAVTLMRGKIGSSIELTVRRDGVDGDIQVEIVRDLIRIRAVRHRREGDIGYIRISTFSDRTESGLIDAIESLTQDDTQPLRGFVVDLRNNPGGLFDQALLVADAFLDNGNIVSVRGRKLVDNSSHDAERGDITDGRDIVVLVNAGSASASEIVASALQDNGRATVVGSRSFGKGSVQTIMPIVPPQRYGALRLTTALYYGPAGHTLQARGVHPDLEVTHKSDQESDTGGIRREEDLDHALTNPNGQTPATGLGASEIAGERCLKLVDDAVEDEDLACAMALLRLGGMSRLASAAAAQQ